MPQFLEVSAGFGFGSAFCRPYSINWNCKKYSKAEESAKYIVRYIGFIFFLSFGHPRITLPVVTPPPSTLRPQHKNWPWPDWSPGLGSHQEPSRWQQSNIQPRLDGPRRVLGRGTVLGGLYPAPAGAPPAALPCLVVQHRQGAGKGWKSKLAPCTKLLPTNKPAHPLSSPGAQSLKHPSLFLQEETFQVPPQ